jgi:hypothetical protein
MARWFGERGAQRALNALGQRLAAGAVALAATPALVAAVDQHAAAVRDILAHGVEGSALVAGAVLLASYARGVLEHAQQHGWTPPAEPDAWRHADWTSVRLLAVWHLANRPLPALPEPA